MKYKYEYEEIKTEVNGIGFMDGKIYEMEFDHREIINKRAENGWKYVGFIPTKQRGTGHIQTFDLIFEKQVENDK